MPPVMVEIQPRRGEVEVEQFDPDTFTPEFLGDVDALAESHKCSCAASDDNPF